MYVCVFKQINTDRKKNQRHKQVVGHTMSVDGKLTPIVKNSRGGNQKPARECACPGYPTVVRKKSRMG